MVQMERFLPLGIVIDGLEPLPRIVDGLFDHPYVETSDTSITAPLYKATPAIAEKHKATRSARDRLQVYLRMGVLDDAVREQVARVFAADFTGRFGRGERRDLFLASANILQISVSLKSLRQLDPKIREAVAQIIWNEPHDAVALARELDTAGNLMPADAIPARPDPNTYTLELKIFFDNIHNPYRLKDPHVLEVVQGSGFKDPVVLEFWTSPAIPGYAWAVVGELAERVGGHPVWMEVSETLR